MKYTDIQLEAIRVFGKKDLTAGCFTLNKEGEMWYAGFSREWCIVDSKDGNSWGSSSSYGEHMGEILGHIPQLSPDLFRVATGMPYGDRVEIQKRGEQYYLMIDRDIAIRTERINIPYNPTIPLLDQPNLAEILNLFK